MRVYALDTEKEADFKRRLNYNYRLVYEIGCATGLRVSDIVSLEKEVLNKREPVIKEQKTGKSKRIYIPVKLKTELKKYSKKNKKYIFETRSKTGHLTRQAVHKHFKKIAEETECHENIGTHTMRKNYALKLLKKGKSLKYIKNKLNHDNLSDTLLYLMKNGF